MQIIKLIRIFRLNNELLPEMQILELARWTYTGGKRSREEKIYKDALVKNSIKIVKLIILTIACAYFLACFWFRLNTAYVSEAAKASFLAEM